MVGAYACRRCPRRGGLSSSPPANPAFSLPSCPLSPPPPLPQRGRGILSFLMQGAPPLASPVAEPGRHLQPLPSKASGGVAGFLPRPKPRQPSATPTQINGCTTSGQYYNRGKFLGVWGLLSRSPQRFLASSLPRPLASLRIRSDCVTIRRGRTYHGNGSRPGRTTRTVCPSTVASCAGGAAHRHQPEEE